MQQAPPAQTLAATLPADAFPGQTYQVQAGDGRLVNFQVPAGGGPGIRVQAAPGESTGGPAQTMLDFVQAVRAN